MNQIRQIEVGYLDDNGQFVCLVWEGTPNKVYLHDLQKLISEKDAQISAFARKCAPIRKPKKFKVSDIARMKSLRKAGFSLREIATEMKCAESTVRNYLKQTP